MNKTFKTIWNAVRSAYVTVNETVAGASQRGGARRAATLMTVSVGAALVSGMAAAGVQKYTGTDGQWSWTFYNFENGGYYDYFASVKQFTADNETISGAVDKVFTNDDLKLLQTVDATGELGSSAPSFAQYKDKVDLWSVIAGASVQTSSEAAVQWSDAAISIKTDALGRKDGDTPYTVMGTAVSDGAITFTGASTTISAENAAQNPADPTDSDSDRMNAIGVGFDNSLGQNAEITTRTVQFNAATTAISAKVTGLADGLAVGLYGAMNTKSKPIVEINSDTTITAVNERANANAYGIWMDYTDGTQNNHRIWNDPGSVTVAAGKTLTITAEGKSAVGAMIDVGTLKINGAANLTAKGTDNAYGLLVRGHGHAIFNGETTIGTDGTGSGAQAAVVLVRNGAESVFEDDWTKGYEAENSEYGIPAPETTAEFNGKTTLNGKVSLGDNTTLKIGGDVTVNGDYVSNGVTSGSGSLTIVNGQNTVFTQASNAVSAQTSTSKDINVSLQLGKLTISGGEVTNNANMLISDTLAITGNAVFINGSASDETDDIWVKTITLDEGSTLRQTGGMHFQVGVVGGKTINVGSASKVEVTSNTTLTLVGSSGDELINFSSTGDKAVDIQGTLKLGSVSVETSGKLTSTVNVEGTVAVENGSFDLTKLTTGTTSSTTAAIEVNKGSLNVGTLELNNGKATISVSDDAKMKVDELAAKAGEHIITGAVEVGKLAQDAANALIQIGTTGESGLKGALTIAEGGLKGLKFFLDPTWKDGMEVTDASSLRIAETNVDGQIVVGQNSYVSLGTTDDSAFVQLFKDGTLTWGGENGTLAAVYVAKPITIASTGSLVVDASLKIVPANDPATGSVTFAADSVLVANVKNFKDGDTAITVDNGASITVAESSKAVVIAEAGQTFQLTNSEEVNKNYWNKAGDTLISANKLVSFNVGADGKITTEAEDAEDVFAGLMQGAALANAGAASDNEAVKSYAEALLTDTTGKKSNAQIAREFDAAMNPAGTLGVFTTAKDRSTELRDAVRAHAGNGTANGLWAQVTGGKTKLKGISTGAQDLDLDTDAYGLAVGGEAALQNITLGAAFMGGSGKTENDSVAGKDDFNYYGISFYAKTQVQGIDLEGDVSAAWLKSDLTVGGAADVDTDTTTAVYSLGIQAKKTFNLGVDVTPFIGMDVYHIKSDGFTTNHGVSIEDANATIVEFPIGAEVKKALQTSSGFSVAPSFSLAVVPTVGCKDIDSKVRFAGAESTYNFTFADDVKVRSQLGIEAQKDNFTLGLAAGYDWGNEERSAASVQLRAKYAF